MALSPPVAADFALPAPAARAGALDTARRALLRHPTLIAGALTLVVILVAGVLAPLWWTGDPLEMKPAVRLRPPSAERWFGSDNFGRHIRSEERRVGEECRSRGSPYHLKKKNTVVIDEERCR